MGLDISLVGCHRDQLSGAGEFRLEEYCITPTTVTFIADNKQDEQLLLLNELWIELAKIATKKEVISYGDVAKKLKKSFGYKPLTTRR